MQLCLSINILTPFAHTPIFWATQHTSVCLDLFVQSLLPVLLIISNLTNVKRCPKFSAVHKNVDTYTHINVILYIIYILCLNPSAWEYQSAALDYIYHKTRQKRLNKMHYCRSNILQDICQINVFCLVFFPASHRLFFWTVIEETPLIIGSQQYTNGIDSQPPFTL